MNAIITAATGYSEADLQPFFVSVDLTCPLIMRPVDMLGLSRIDGRHKERQVIFRRADYSDLARCCGGCRPGTAAMVGPTWCSGVCQK
jgi:hypothetical protein